MLARAGRASATSFEEVVFFRTLVGHVVDKTRHLALVRERVVVCRRVSCQIVKGLRLWLVSAAVPEVQKPRGAMYAENRHLNFPEKRSNDMM